MMIAHANAARAFWPVTIYERGVLEADRLAVTGLRDDDIFLGHKVDFTADECCAIVPQSLGGRRVLI